MVEVHEWDYGGSLRKRVDLMFANPPYDVRRLLRNAHVAHDKLGVDYMTDMVHFCEDMIEFGGNKYVVCTALQFSACQKQLLKDTDVVMSDDESMVEENSYSSIKMMLQFLFEVVSLLYS